MIHTFIKEREEEFEKEVPHSSINCENGYCDCSHQTGKAFLNQSLFLLCERLRKTVGEEMDKIVKQIHREISDKNLIKEGSIEILSTVKERLVSLLTPTEEE